MCELWLLVSVVILQAPANATVPLGHTPVTFTCRIQGESLFWRIDGQLYNYITAIDFRTRGISAATQAAPMGQRHETVTMAVSARNNNSVVVCQGTVFNFPSTFTDPAILRVVGMLYSRVKLYAISYKTTDFKLQMFHVHLAYSSAQWMQTQCKWNGQNHSLQQTIRSQAIP